MRLVCAFLITAGMTLFLCSCGESSNSPTGGTTPAYIGTWEYDTSISIITMSMIVVISPNHTFSMTNKIGTLTESSESGTWTATADSIILMANSCMEDTAMSGTLSDVSCDDPNTAENEARQTASLHDIHGNIWYVPAGPEGGTFALVKQ